MSPKTELQRSVWISALAVLVNLLSTLAFTPSTRAATPQLKFEVSFPDSVRSKPITARVDEMICNEKDPERRLPVGSWSSHPPFFGIDTNRPKPGEPAVTSGTTLGYPVKSLKRIPAGDYYV